VNRSIEQMKRAAAMGAKLELCAVDPLIGRDAHLAWMQAWAASALREDGSRQSKRGCRALHLGIDLGQTGNPSHTDGLQMFPTDLLGEGLRACSPANDEWIVPLFGSEAEEALPG